MGVYGHTHQWDRYRFRIYGRIEWTKEDIIGFIKSSSKHLGVLESNMLDLVSWKSVSHTSMKSLRGGSSLLARMELKDALK